MTESNKLLQEAATSHEPRVLGCFCDYGRDGYRHLMNTEFAVFDARSDEADRLHNLLHPTCS